VGGGRAKLGYIVSTWPRLSQTFVLTEVLELERRGVPLRIFSIKEPGNEPVHGELRLVRAKATYLALGSNRKRVLRGNLAALSRHPIRYVRTLWRALVLNPRWSFLQSFLQAGYVADLLSRESITHLHAHFATAPTSVAMFAHHLTGIPYTFTAHAKDIYFDVKPKLLRAKMKHARAVVTISDYNRKHLTRLTPPMQAGKVHCVYNGMDLRRYATGDAIREKPPVPTILTVARLIEKKGIGQLIRACQILRERGRSFCLEIIGKGTLRPSLKAQVDSVNMQNMVRFRGALPQETVREAYAQAAIFALPCVISDDGDRDGIPTVLLEAMACGLPVVSTHVSGIPELVESGRDGILVPAGNTEMLAEALDRLLVNGDLRETLGAAACEKVVKRFSVERSVTELLGLFRLEGTR
jgi:glycosyltransferase involved in cell wall biosynthesis